MESKSEHDAQMKQFEKDVRGMFDVIDTNANKWISIDELGHGLKVLGFSMTYRELQIAGKEIDKNKNGRIEYGEFRDFMLKQYRQLNKRSNKDRQVRQAFRMFDRDGNGYIDKKELKRAMTSLGERMSDDEIQTMLNEADENEDGRIDYEEFLTMWNMKFPDTN